MLYSKQKLWLTVNGLCTIPSIDRRNILLNTLDSLDNNIFVLRQQRIPELQNIQSYNYEYLRYNLFDKYLHMIKDTNDNLAELIMQDLYNIYTPEINESYNVYMIGGGGDDDQKPRGKPPLGRAPPKISAPPLGAPPSIIRSIPSTSKSSSVPIGNLPPPPPPPPPPGAQFNSNDDIVQKTKLLQSQSPKLSSDQLKEKRKELLKYKVVPKRPKGLEMTIDNQNNERPVISKDALIAILQQFKEKNKENKKNNTDIKPISSLSTKRSTNTNVPALVSVDITDSVASVLPEVSDSNGNQVYDLIQYDRIKQNTLDLVLEVRDDEQFDLYNRIINLSNDRKFNPIDKSKGKNAFNNLKKLLEDKINDRPELPQWRKNYMLLNEFLKYIIPDTNDGDQISGGQLIIYKDNILRLAEYINAWATL